MRLRNRRAALAVGAAAIAVTAVAVPIVQANADTAAETSVNTLTWNIEGGYNGGFGEQLDEVMKAVKDKDPDFLVVNELCSVQYDSMKERLVESGWTKAKNYARYSTMDTRKSCNNGKQDKIGFGIFSKQNLKPSQDGDETQLYADPHSPGRKHFVNCVTPEDSPDVRMCGTHLVPNTGLDGEPNDSNVKQVKDLNKTLSSYVDDGKAVVVAGDFNARPNWGRLDSIYAESVDTEANSGNTGAFRELDDDNADHCLGYGAGTMDGGDRPEPCNQDEGVKIDMIFASEANISGDYSAEVLAIPETCKGDNDDDVDVCSDHHAVSGTLAFKA